MKKMLLCLSLLASTVCLSSCAVNWFGETLDTPWYCIALPVLLIFAIGYAILMSKTYICPSCKTEFKAKPYQLYVTVHLNGKRIARCPVCHRKGFCNITK